MDPGPDHGEHSYVGRGRLTDKKTIVPTTKGAIHIVNAGLGQMLAGRAIRVNAVSPGPVWTPLIPSTMPRATAKNFGENTPIGRAAQPAELAPASVLLAGGEASYILAATIAATGGGPLL
ncbi:SDR family oxidoreductase [Sphingomonas yunnanensis]|uniref:SDR family oxidoreductase n=1 Tax=Sphingomonas yunnanensis TaxID=310400 RepID=UPI001CA641E1|nr:SDR family oxidoreductase [Sphingomonas yunnanensis]MBY9065172.1 SDR family oxidoreductase [Sphingomonas yunnanensis]